MNLLLETALEYAEKVRIVLLRVPGCHQVEIAGSVRRRCHYVGDLDFVVQAELRQPVRDKLVALGCRLESDGEDIVRCFSRTDVQIDIFFARMPFVDLLAPVPSNWGSVLLCRTGSLAHNIYLIEHAKALGLRWNPREGVFDATGRLLASETEDSIFKALQLDFIEPEKRER